jgi:hypothetical protein
MGHHIPLQDYFFWIALSVFGSGTIVIFELHIIWGGTMIAAPLFDFDFARRKLAQVKTAVWAATNRHCEKGRICEDEQQAKPYDQDQMVPKAQRTVRHSSSGVIETTSPILQLALGSRAQR